MGIEEITIEADGFITREEDIKPLERVTDNTANPTTECLYPNCEKCSRYVGLGGVYYCTVPMVVNKQIWLVTASKIRRMEKCMTELQTVLYDHILGVENDNDTDTRRL